MTRLKTETTRATRGLAPTTRGAVSFQVRLLGFALAVGAFGLLIARFDETIWRAQGRLQEGFAAIKTEKFYVGVNFRTSLRKVRETLLDYELTKKPEDLEAFEREARELKDWLRTKEMNFVAPRERGPFARLESAYDEFLARATNSAPQGGADFEAAYLAIRQDSQPVLKACEDLVQAERQEFDAFLRNSDNALASLQRLFLMSLLLLVALALCLAVLVYRGMIAPLRAQLSESQTIIERQEKLASLGALGAGVAHEIRNPLTAIKFRLFSLKASLSADFGNHEDIRVISEEINRLDRIVKDFLQFARPSDPELVQVPGDRILKEVFELMKPELEPAAIDLKLEVVHPAWIEADTAQLKQVLINLVQNSADSIGRQGRVTLRLARGMANFNGSAGAAAILAVADSGKGIPAEVQKRLFDPFFTTKEGGTGLGLAIAARIVEKHGGLLRYKTELDRGTIFEIVLPEPKEHAS